jgi:hypothetical protein
MTTGIDLITRSLRTIGVLGIGETPDSEQAANGLITINDVLQSWSNEGLLIYLESLDSLALTGAATYTVGTGGVFNILRPTQIHSAYYLLNSIKYPVAVLTDDQYDSISYSSQTSTNWVDAIYLSPSYPLATLYVYPVCTGGTLYIRSWQPLTELSTLTTALSFPVGYEAALREAVADAMQSEYGKNRPKVTADAMRLKAGLKRANHKPPLMNTSTCVGTNSVARIMRGY